MNKQKTYFALILIVSHWNVIHSMEKTNKRIKRQRTKIEQRQENPIQCASLSHIATKAFFKQNATNVLMQLEQYPLPQELYPAVLDEAFIAKQKKEVLIEIFKNVSSEDYTELAVKVVYSRQNMHLSAKDKIHLLKALQQLYKKGMMQKLKQIEETEIVLSTLIAAAKTLNDSHNNFKSHSTRIFYHTLKCQGISANILVLLLNHGLPHNTNGLISKFIQTFDYVEPKYYEETLRKLSLLVDARIPFNIKINESTMDNGIKHNGSLFPNSYHYLQHKIACMSKQEMNSNFKINFDEKKAFFEKASSLVKQR